MNNVINKFFLWIVLLPINLYGKMGVNVLHLKAILRNKLIMDDRRPNTMQQTKRRKEKAVNLATLGTMLLSALMGCLFLVAFSVGNDYTLQLTIYFSMYIFLLASSLISDFTSVLIDIRDNYIILPKPVNDRTIVVSRLLHIMIHVSKMVLPMSLPGIVYLAYNAGTAGAIVFAALVVFATLLTIFLINALYILILKITTPQKFQGIISTFQIVFAILLYGSYQIVPRMLDRSGLENLDFTKVSKWIWVAPPYWFARAWQTITQVSFTTGGLCSVALSIIVPLASIYLVIKYFAPSFNQKLSLINSSNAENVEMVGNKLAKTSRTTPAYVTAFASRLCKKGAERMSFIFSWNMTTRSKDFKLKVYPSIGYMIVMLGVMFFQSRTKYSLDETTGRLPFLLVGVIYFSSFVLIMAISQLAFSDKYKAAWIYYSTPVSHPGLLISGAFKAIVVKFYLPVVVLAFTAALILIGPSILPNLFLALFNELFICSFITYITVRELPFSMQQGNNRKAGSFIKGLLTFVIPATVAVLHFLIYKILIVVCIFAAMSMLLTWLIQGSISQISWVKVKGVNEG